MVKRIQATIKFDTKDNHPDEKNARGLEYTDVYRIDTNYFYDDDHIQEYIQRDLLLIAGGGYVTNTVENTKITFKVLSNV